VKRLGLLLAAALVALMAVAPIASAHHGRKLGRARAFCGSVDPSSALPGTLVVFTGPRKVTIANPRNVPTTGAVPGAEICVLVRRARAGGQLKSWTLVRLRVQPSAVVTAVGPVTISSGIVRVATLTFTVPSGKTLPSTIANGDTVLVIGKIASPGDPLTLARIHELKVRAMAHHGRRPKLKTSVVILGNVTALTAATDTSAGDLQVAGIDLSIPPKKTLRKRVAVGARVIAKAVLSSSVLTLKRVVVVRRAPAA
jgi:hypothetical protein